VYSKRTLRRATLTVILAAVVGLAANGAGCSPGGAKPASRVAEPVIRITYSTTFAGETAAGNLNLAVNMTIENKGYASFNAQPTDFSVKVDNYSYMAAENSFEALALPDGGSIRGKLVFQVRPQAATSRVGFTMLFSGKTPYEIEWVKSAAAPGKTPAGSASDAVVDITYSTELAWIAAPGNRYLVVEPPGSLYLVVEMTIVNDGYESFNTSPQFFTLQASSERVSVPAVVQQELIDWRVVDLQNQGRHTGVLFFRIPTEIAQSFYRWEYKMHYSGNRAYNVSWEELRVTMTSIDVAASDLRQVSLSDGGSVRGKLAFSILPEMASDRAKYRLMYNAENIVRNVQWFDSPTAVVDTDRNPISYPVIKVTYSTSLLKTEDPPRLYLIVDATIENMGYESFTTPAAKFVLKITY
jgi:hypothetical protein